MGDAAAANLSYYLNPHLQRGHYYRIIYIDRLLGTIQLSDYSVWHVTAWDSIASWMLGDVILIGANIDWKSESFANILINANILDDVRADFRGYLY